MSDSEDCPHSRTDPWRRGTPTGGPPQIRTVAGETLARSWAMCLDCGVRLERAEVVRRDA